MASASALAAQNGAGDPMGAHGPNPWYAST